MTSTMVAPWWIPRITPFMAAAYPSRDPKSVVSVIIGLVTRLIVRASSARTRYTPGKNDQNESPAVILTL